MVRWNLKAHPKMPTCILEGKGLEEAAVLPYWKLSGISSGSYNAAHSSDCANQSHLAVCMTKLFAGSRWIIWPIWNLLVWVNFVVA